MGRVPHALLLAAAVGLGACAPGPPPEVDAVLALRGPGDTVAVRHLDPPEGGEVGERWELTFTTTEHEALVDAVRHHYIARARPCSAGSAYRAGGYSPGQLVSVGFVNRSYRAPALRSWM